MDAGDPRRIPRKVNTVLDVERTLEPECAEERLQKAAKSMS
jgi:hypothetical protein